MNPFSKSRINSGVISVTMLIPTPLIFTIHLEPLLTWQVGVLSFDNSPTSQENKRRKTNQQQLF
jgi:hypothetical protein